MSNEGNASLPENDGVDRRGFSVHAPRIAWPGFGQVADRHRPNFMNLSTAHQGPKPPGRLQPVPATAHIRDQSHRMPHARGDPFWAKGLGQVP